MLTCQSGHSAPNDTNQVNISGYVKHVSGKPVDMVVTVDALGLGNQGGVRTDHNGHYEKRVPAAEQYIVGIEPGPVKSMGRYSFPTGHLTQRVLVKQTGNSLRQNFVARDGGTLWLKAWDETGHEMHRQDFLRSDLVAAYPPGAFPHGESIETQYRGIPLFWGWIKDSEKNTACLLLPPNRPATIWAVWRVPEVGTTYLHADNNGKGFLVAAGDVKPVNLVYEFAKTAYRTATLQCQQFKKDGYVFSPVVSEGLTKAQEDLSLAECAQRESRESDAAVRSYRVLTAALHSREQMILEKASADVETYRKGELAVTVTDANGKALSDASVDYRQVSHSFIFSVSHPQQSQYKLLRNAGFEYVNFEHWWGEVEPNDGDYKFPDGEAQALRRSGFGIAMLCGLWFTTAYPPAIPKFATTMTPEQLSVQAYQYSRAVVSHYGDRMKIYNALNEPDLAQAYNLTRDQMVEIIRASVKGAKDANPNTLVFVNTTNPIFDSFQLNPVQFLTASDMSGHPRAGVSTFASPLPSGYEVAKALLDAKIPFDALGVEFYYGVVLPPIDLGMFSDALDFYRSLEKPIFVSELSYATSDDYPGLNKFWYSYGGWHEGYTDKAQAAWAKAAITIAFSKSHILGIQWVGANDGPPDYDFVGFGLFHKDGITPRPVITEIQELIHSWTTIGQTRTDAKGQTYFRGFGGDYELLVTTRDGRKQTIRAQIYERKTNTVQVIFKNGVEHDGL